MRHIGQDVPRRHTHFVLESRLMYEKSFRDEWMRSLCQAVSNLDEPLAYANVSYWTMNKMVRSGNMLVHRVHYTGWGTDKTLKQGGWEHRWNKVMQRNALQYNRI